MEWLDDLSGAERLVDLLRGIACALLLTAVLAGLFLAGWKYGATHRPELPPVEHHVFYTGRTRTFVGDEDTEIEVFRDQAGNWVACVWKRGRCWCGTLKLRTRRD